MISNVMNRKRLAEFIRRLAELDRQIESLEREREFWLDGPGQKLLPNAAPQAEEIGALKIERSATMDTIKELALQLVAFKTGPKGPTYQLAFGELLETPINLSDLWTEDQIIIIHLP